MGQLIKKLKKLNYGKILAVIFLTALIWIWADLMLEETLEISSTLTVARSGIDPNIFVTLGSSDQTTVPLESIVLKGPASKIAGVKQQLNEGTLDLSRMFFNPEQYNMTGSGPHILDMKQFLRDKTEIAELGLTVESTNPERVQVRITELVEQQVQVQAIDENGHLIENANLEPDQISMFVPDYNTRKPDTAKIMLTPSQIADARLNPPVTKKPYVLILGHQKKADDDVKVSISKQETPLEDHIISRPTLGFVFTESMAGRYGVESENQTDMTSVIVQGTSEAIQAYENQPYKLLLYILDEDKRKDTTIERPVVFNFPQEYVRTGQIKISPNQSLIKAKFRLIELSGPVSPAGGDQLP